MTQPKYIETYAYCTLDHVERDFAGDQVHRNHLYKVVRFVDEDGFFPYGVRIADMNGNELKPTFYAQRFTYFHINLN